MSWLKRLINRAVDLQCDQQWIDPQGKCPGTDTKHDVYGPHLCGLPHGDHEIHRCRRCGATLDAAETETADEPAEARSPPDEGGRRHAAPADESEPVGTAAVETAPAAMGQAGKETTNPHRDRWITFGRIKNDAEALEETVTISIGPDPVVATLRRCLDEDANELTGNRWQLVWNRAAPSAPNPIYGSWATLECAKAALRTALGEIAEEPRELLSFSAAVPRTTPGRPKRRMPIFSVRIFWYGRPFSGSIDYEPPADGSWEPEWTVRIEPDEETDLDKIDGAVHKRLSAAKRHVAATFAEYLKHR